MIRVGDEGFFSEAKGEATNVQYFSRISNIIGTRKAETEALEKALEKILNDCGDEYFNLEGQSNFVNSVFEGKVYASQKYKCL